MSEQPSTCRLYLLGGEADKVLPFSFCDDNVSCYSLLYLTVKLAKSDKNGEKLAVIKSLDADNYKFT